MDGIVLELEREALDENVSVETLLRKAYLVAKKLKLTDFEEWLNSEQNGYHGEVPEYRMISGNYRAWNPYRGWIPVYYLSMWRKSCRSFHYTIRFPRCGMLIRQVRAALALQ